MKYRAIIFDMDGTIVHTEHIWKKATIELLQSHGITLTQKDIDELKHHLSGIGLTQGCTYIKEKFGMQAPLCDIIEQKAARAHALYAQEICFITGFIEFHQLVKKQNIATGLATNAHPDTVTLTNTKLNLQQFFGNHMYNISHVNNVGKPNPDIYPVNTLVKTAFPHKHRRPAPIH